MKIFSQGTKDYATLGLSNILVAGISGLFWFILARLLDTTEYGLIGYLFSISQIGYTVANIGLGQLIVVYGAKKEDIFSQAFSFGLISISIISIIIYAIIQNISVVFLMWGLMVFMLHQSDLNSKKKYGSFAKYNILQRTLVIIFAISLYEIFGVDGIILGAGLAGLVGAKIIYTQIKTKGFSVSGLKLKIRFITNVYFTNLITTLFWWGDKLLIGPLFGFAVLGNYQLAIQYVLFLHAIPVALMTYLLPQEAQGLKNKKLKIFALLIAIGLVIISIILIPNILPLVLSEYQDSIIPMQIMSVGIFPIVISAMIESRFLGHEKTNLVLISNGIQLGFYFSLIVILGQEMGLVGLAYSFLIATIVRAIFYLSANQLFYKKIG